MTKKFNWFPALVAFAPALLLPLVQDVVRPRVHHLVPLMLLLASAPNLVVGFCFPFGILVRPTVWTRKTANVLFAVWCGFTLSALIAVEYLSPFGRNVFDPHDMFASVAGVGMAIGIYVVLVRKRLSFAGA